MNPKGPTHESCLKVLPGYTGVRTLEDAIGDPRSLRVLWLEILFNDSIDLGVVLEHPAGREAYQKACRWYRTYRSLIQEVIPRAPLPDEPGPIDPREYRTFAEALHFVSSRP